MTLVTEVKKLSSPFLYISILNINITPKRLAEAATFPIQGLPASIHGKITTYPDSDLA
jgi:hypothetical protein